MILPTSYAHGVLRDRSSASAADARTATRARRALAIVAAPLASGCAPMIGHGPVVHPGPSVGASAALGSGPTYENGDDPGPFYVGGAMVQAAYGWQPASGRLPAARIGVQGPVEDGVVAADVYLQAPRAWLGPTAVGVGALVDGRRTMPYAQVGAHSARGFGGHVVVGRYDQGRRHFIGYWSHERATVTWLSVQLPVAGRATVHLHGGLARGHVTRQWQNATTPYIDEDRWVRLGGLTLELHRPRR